MTGIEELRHLAQHIRTKSATGYVTVVASHHAIELEIIADQIERERACDEDAIETIRLIVGGVIDDMERHVSGVEGAEDSPVARWARELRYALKSGTSDGRDAQSPSWHDPAEMADVSSEVAKVTRDPAEDVSVSAYDLLPQEERDAIAWVREHGGLDAVKKLLGWVVGHCSTRQQLDFDFWLSGRVMHELGFDEDMADRDEVERRLLARLMPEGYEWPRYESGEPLRYEDRYVYDGREREVWHVDFDSYGEPTILNKDGTRFHPDKGERVKRPAPKVPDADGVETRVKETVFDKNTGEELIVTGFENGRVWCEHRMTDADALPVRGMWSPDQLTHERPIADTWERLEEDAEKDPCDYFGFDGEETCGKCPASGKNCEQTMARDLVRRCRALAEREGGE